jgi:fermentation-respiration switch protein FrsA (DUF1100 family)
MSGKQEVARRSRQRGQFAVAFLAKLQLNEKRDLSCHTLLSVKKIPKRSICIIKTGEAVSPWSSVRAGRFRQMPSRTRCSCCPLKAVDVPTLFIHGDDDQIVPIGAAALLASKIVKGATLKIYEGGSHGICSTQKDEVNADLLAFIKG